MEENLQSSSVRAGAGSDSNSFQASVCSLVNHSGAAVQSRGADTIVETSAEVPSIRCSLIRPAVLPNRRFVLGSVTGPADGNSRVGIGPAPSVDQQRIAFRIVFASFQVLRHVNQSS